MAINMSFINSIHPDFIKDLKSSVEFYFKNNQKQTTGDWRLFHKAILLGVALLSLYILLLFVGCPVWVNLIMCVLLGATVALIGFNVMHDGGHGSYSNKKWVNHLMSYSLNLLGGSSYLWKVKHNVMHHTYTNIEGHDDDIDIEPFMRTNKNQKKCFIHHFQHIYAPFLYAVTYIFWIGYNDFVKYFTGKILNKKIPHMNMRTHIGFWFTKGLYIFLFIVVPFWAVGWQHLLIGYFIVAGVAGFIMSIVFQLAHVIEEVDFPLVDKNTHKIEENWFIHQLQTTSNFATKNKIVTWCTGGLNFQVEHHLFPKINHIHYPAINKIVKDICKKYNIVYHEHHTVIKALHSHFRYLKQIGQMA